MPIEKNATLQIYEWAGVLWNKVLDEFQSEYSCKVEVTTYSSAVEGITKLASGKLAMDSFDIGPDMLGKLVAGEIIQPLNHSYIPNITKYWSEFQNPFYDQGWRYTLPSSVYQTGIGYRRDVIPDNKIWGMKNPYEIYWDPAYSGRVGIYDDYREAIGMVLLKNGIIDVVKS